MRYLLVLFALCCSFSVFALPHPSKINRVIYITLDGTRWQDVLQDKVLFPKLWSKYASLGKFYGMPNAKDKMEVASIPISLPSYQSQMSGSVQPCDGNGCGRITVETMPEYLMKQNLLTKKDVAIFSSWYEIEYASEHEIGNVFTNTGNVPVADPITHEVDAVMEDLNYEQALNTPEEHRDRFDRYTVAQAFHFYDKYQPRFFWISLDDGDVAAHRGSLEDYHNALSFYDDFLDELFTMLMDKNMFDDTLVIVTTDHGRGNGDNWTSHGPEYPESKRTWAFVMNGELLPDQQNDYYSTLSIRPTIEKALLGK